MRILLVQPATFDPGRLGLENSLWLSETVALTSLAATVPEHEVRSWTCGGSPTSSCALLEFRPGAVEVFSLHRADTPW